MRTLQPISTSGQLLRLPELGDTVVRVTRRASTHRLSARWSNGTLHTIAPAATPMADILHFLSANAATLLKRRPTLRYHIGQQLAFEPLTITIGSQKLKPRHILMQGELMKPKILVGTEMQLDSDNTTALISRLLCVAARSTAPSILLPQAEAIAQRLGVRPPLGWKISHGHHTLGHCSSKGEIALSEILVMAPPHLREYIICHELAHLTAFDHSPRFHAICDRYLGGREQSLIKQLKAYKWPILRK